MSLYAQSGARWEVWLSDHYGNRLGILDGISKLEYFKGLNQLGYFDIEIAAPWPKIYLDFMIEFWRAPAEGTLSCIGVGFARDWYYRSTTEALTMRGPDQHHLLSRRIVAYAAGSAQAEKTDYADDMLKAIVYDNFGAGAAAARQLSLLSIQGDLSEGPSITKAFAWQNVTEALNGIAETSKTAGTELFYRLIPEFTDTTITFEFQTWINQLRDRTASSATPVYFGEDFGNMENPELEWDHRDEINYVYAGGQDTEDRRTIQEFSDTNAINIAPYNLCETFADARDQDGDNGVQSRAKEVLSEGRYRKRFSADLLDVPGTRYQKDWNVGDRVTARHRGEEYDALIRGMRITLDGDGNESIEAKLEADE